MKILFIIRDLGFGGAQRQLVLLANALAARGYQPVIAAFYAGGGLARDLSRDVRVAPLHKRGRWDVLGFACRLASLVRQERPDIVHGYLPVGNICATFARKAAPHAKLIWGVRASEHDSGDYDCLSSLTHSLEAQLSSVPDRVIVNSAAGIRYCTNRGFPPASMVHIPNAIDTGAYYPDNADRERLRREWGMGGSDKLVGLIGRRDPMKGHAVFLHAAAWLKTAELGVRFACVGNGSDDYSRRMEALSEDLGLSGRLLWLGARPDMRAVYNALDVVCSASVYGEGFPNVLGEAMACGRPCTVTDVGDSAIVAGGTQVVVPPNNAPALAAGILRQLDTPIPGGKLGRDRITQHFSIAKLADRTDLLFRNLYEQRVLPELFPVL